jgi:hypothetical protein
MTLTVCPGAVWSYNATTVAGSSNGSWGNSAALLAFPTGVSVDNSGAIYVCDAENRRVQKWLSGASMGTTVVAGTNGSGLNQFYGSSYII